MRRILNTLFGSIFITVAWTGVAIAQSHSSVLMPPYLQGVTTSSIYVLVESVSPDTVSVEYGPDTTYGSVARTETIEPTTERTYVHNVLIQGLRPNTVYHYRAQQGSSVTQGASFRTAPEPGTAFRFAWMADFRRGKEVHDSIAAMILRAGPVVSLYGGDISGTGSYSSYKEEFFRPNQLSLISRVPFFNATGNHEGWGANTIAFTQAPASPSVKQEYYSVDYGDMHVLVLNTELSCGAGSEQYLFADQDLARSTAAWKIVAAHDHAYCGGGHGEDEALKAMTRDIFEPRKVDVVISGHSHFYQHNIVNGIHHMILGSAGAPLYDPVDKDYTIKSVKDYNFGIGDVTPRRLEFRVFNALGEPLDSLVLAKPPSDSGDGR